MAQNREGNGADGVVGLNRKSSRRRLIVGDDLVCALVNGDNLGAKANVLVQIRPKTHGQPVHAAFDFAQVAEKIAQVLL